MRAYAVYKLQVIDNVLHVMCIYKADKLEAAILIDKYKQYYLFHNFILLPT